MGESLTDAEVIAASLEDARAFAPIFDRHYDAIYRYLSRRGGDRVAEDLAGEVFATALRNRARYDLSQPHCRPWLFGIATNLLRRHWRTEARRLRALARRGGDRPEESPLSRVDDRLAAAQVWPSVAEAIARLSPGDRDALLLDALGDLSYEEIAQALGIPMGTVKSRLHRARQAIREHLGRSGQEPTEGDRAPLRGDRHG